MKLFFKFVQIDEMSNLSFFSVPQKAAVKGITQVVISRITMAAPGMSKYRLVACWCVYYKPCKLNSLKEVGVFELHGNLLSKEKILSHVFIPLQSSSLF